jgi:serine protease Do
MESNNNNNEPKDYSDFFKPQDEKSDSAKQDRENVDQDLNRSYYYSYGPNKSSNDTSSYGNNDTTSSVEVTPPRPLRPFNYNGGDSGFGGAGTKKRSSFRSAVAVFLAGALVMGSLMYASDTMNWFTGKQSLAAAIGTTAAIPSSNPSTSGGPAKAGLDLSRPSNISTIVDGASPAVVKIESLVTPSSQGSGGNSLFNDPFFRQFFGDQSQGQQSQPQNNTPQAAGMGSGFIFEKSGYILTNQHVIDGADQIQVTVQGYDKPLKATKLGESYALDLAVLKIEGTKDFPTLPLGNSDNVKVGDWVVAIGNPYGFDHTVTVGVLSAKERPISIPDTKGTRDYKHLFQTDASINPGNSGGPLLNTNGEVIGINTAVSSQAQGIGFAIPTSTISTVIDSLKNNITIPIPYIGVQLQDISADWTTELKLQSTDGSIIANVERKSPAFTGGLRPYDVVVEVNGVKIKNTDELTTKIKAAKVGDKVTLGVIRDGKKSDMTVIVGDRNTASTTGN